MPPINPAFSRNPKPPALAGGDFTAITKVTIMKNRFTLLLSLLAFIVSGPVFAAQVDASYPLEKIEDGDTLVLSIEGESVRVQLLGIDAPEDSHNPKFKSDLSKTEIDAEELLLLGKAATEHMQALVKEGEMMTIQGVLRAPDRYGRTPAIVSNAKGRDLSEAMVQDGFAIAMPPSEEDSEFIRRLDRLERFARKSNNGLWGRYPELSRNWYDRTR